jgi:Ca-activated chloride channel family protein
MLSALSVTLPGAPAQAQQNQAQQQIYPPPPPPGPPPPPPPGPPPPMPPPMPHPIIQRSLTLTDMSVKVEIRGAVAHTTIRQTLRNDNSWVAEGQYMLPLPAGASVSDFAIIDGDKRLTPKVVDAAEARRIYQEIVRKMRDPGLLEYQNNGCFSVSVFPFQPGQSRSIEVSFAQALSGTTALVSYQLPLRWAGWSRCGDQYGGGASFALSYSIDSDYDLGPISSPAYAVTVNREGNRHASGSFETKITSFTNDFVLNIGRRTGDFAASLFCFPGDPGEDGYFLLSLLAALPKSDTYIPKDVLFIVDKSGSMSGEKIEQAKGAARFVFGQLKPQDRFGVIYYSDNVDKVFDGLREASADNVAQARSFVDALAADGGTDIYSALGAGAEMIKPDGRPCYAVFLTDGCPTVGDTNIDHIIANAKERFDKQVKLFVFGVGYDVNTTLLDSLSYDHHGSATYVSENENIEVKVSQFYARMSSPALTSIAFMLSTPSGKWDVYDVMPKDLPDLFHDNEIFITGRYRGRAPATAALVVQGQTDKGAQTLKLDGVQANAGMQNHQIPRLWAARKVSYLLDQLRLHGDNKELLGEIDRLATRYGIVTPYTSYLITEPQQYFSEEMRLGGLTMHMAESRADQSGKAAVGRSKMNQANQAAAAAAAPQMAGGGAGGEKDEELLDRAYVKYSPSWFGNYSNSNATQVNYVNNQTFVVQADEANQRAQYVDARYNKDAQRKIRVTAYGDEYFKLVDEFPPLADYLSQSESVVLVLNDKLALETTSDEVKNTPAELDELRAALSRGEYNQTTGDRGKHGTVAGVAGGGPSGPGWGWIAVIGLLALSGAAWFSRLSRLAARPLGT